MAVRNLGDDDRTTVAEWCRLFRGRRIAVADRGHWRNSLCGSRALLS
jgi:hypothetical protein